MLAQLTNSISANLLLRISVFYLIALIVSLLLKHIARSILKSGRPGSPSHKIRPERKKTLEGLITNAISLFAFAGASIASVGLFIEPDTLAWMVGLFSAAFGLGARPLISDYLAGISFIFEDTFSVGEKIEIPGMHLMEGVVEAINLRTTLLRANRGELFVVPNGEIRIIRNFSRGKFSNANITLKIGSQDLGSALPLLEDLGKEAVALLPNLLEPWQVISESGMMGQYTELTLIARARFGKASEMRPRLLALVQERLAEIHVALAN